MTVTKLKQILLIISGFVCVGLGAVGAVVPLLPTVPLLLLAGFCFAKSSKRLNDWFVGTKLYKNHLEEFVSGNGMTKRAKLRTMAKITFLMLLGMSILFIYKVWLGFAVTGIVWVCLGIYFTFGIKTIRE